MFRLALLVAAFTAATFAQSTEAAPAYPNYFVSTGGGYTRNAVPNAAEGWVSAAVQIGANSPYYSITTVDMTSATSTIRTGIAKIFGQTGNLTLLGRMDAGISTVAPVIGNFSGGALLLYNLKGFSPKFANVFLLGEVRISAATSTTTAVPNQVTPGFYFGIGKSF
jgi:hypothetical protein